MRQVLPILAKPGGSTARALIGVSTTNSPFIPFITGTGPNAFTVLWPGPPADGGRAAAKTSPNRPPPSAGSTGPPAVHKPAAQWEKNGQRGFLSLSMSSHAFRIRKLGSLIYWVISAACPATDYEHRRDLPYL